MGFTEVSDLDAQTTVSIGGFNKKAKKENPSSAEGYYLGTKTVSSPKSKNGKASLHILQTPKGNLGVWGKTDMDRKMQQVTPGTMIRIEHSGMQATPNGEMYKYKVLVDADNTIDVPKFSNNTEAAEDSGSDDTDEYQAPVLDQEDNVDEQAAAAARRTKLQSLLNKKK